MGSIRVAGSEGARLNSKSTKAKRKAIPGFTLAELVAAGRLPPFFHLRDVFDELVDQNPACENVPAVSTLAEVDKRDGVERFDHLMDPPDKYLANEERRASGSMLLHGRNEQ